MLLEISKFSKFNKKNWDLKYSNSEFDKILELIIRNLEYEYIEMLIWSFQLNLFNDIKYKILDMDGKFSVIKLDKVNSIKILNQDIYDEIRYFEIYTYNKDEKLFSLISDNYGEHTSITIGKNISKDMLDKMMNAIFKGK